MNEICLTMQQNLIFKKAAGVDTSKFAKKVDLVNLRSDVDKLDIDELMSSFWFK